MLRKWDSEQYCCKGMTIQKNYIRVPFFPRNLTPVEVNYDIENQELLAVKATIEEWWHWSEGALHPFTVLTDHWNLKYIRQVRRLNHFHFTIYYHPGSKNIKAHALSRHYAPPEQDSSPKAIIPSSMVVAQMRWDMDADIFTVNIGGQTWWKR